MIKRVICLIVVILTTLSAYAQDVKETRSLAELKKEVQEKLARESQGRDFLENMNPNNIDPDKVFEALADYQRAVQESSDKKAFTKPSEWEQFSRAVADTLSLPGLRKLETEGIPTKVEKVISKVGKVAKGYGMAGVFAYSFVKQNHEIMAEPRVKAAAKLGEALRPGMVGPVDIVFVEDELGHAVALSLVAYDGVSIQFFDIPMRATNELTIVTRVLLTQKKSCPDFVVTKKGVTQPNALLRNITVEQMLGKLGQEYSRAEVHNKIIDDKFTEVRSKFGNVTNTTLSDSDAARVNAISQKIQELETDYKSRVAKNRFSPVDADILQTELDLVMLGLKPELISSTINVKKEVRLALVKNTFLKEMLAKQKQNALITDLLNKSAVGDKNALAELYKEREKIRELEKKSPTYDQRVVERYLNERIGLIEARNKLQELEKKSPTYDQREMIRSLNREISKHESYGRNFQDRKNSDGRYNDDNYSAPSGWGGNSDGKYNDDNYSAPSKSHSDRDRDTRSTPTDPSPNDNWRY